MKALFLSDAHLRSPQDDSYRQLLDLLDHEQDLDGLFLLGDIFEFWIGYDNLVFAPYIPLLERLRTLSQRGTALYFVEGNHDFLMGPYFHRELNCHVITDQQTIKWDGLDIHLCHGDLIHPTPSYLLLRKFWRSFFIRALKRFIHPDPAWRLALWLSDKSLQRRRHTAMFTPREHLINYSRQTVAADCDMLVCGHFHIPVTITDHHPAIFALGDWATKGCYLLLEGGIPTLKNYDV